MVAQAFTFEELGAIRGALATVVVCALDKDDESVEFGQGKVSITN